LVSNRNLERAVSPRFVYRIYLFIYLFMFHTACSPSGYGRK
jgi:hypothetical protein